MDDSYASDESSQFSLRRKRRSLATISTPSTFPLSSGTVATSSDRIPLTSAVVNAPGSRDSTFRTANARRLGIRNAGFRAPLLSRITPPHAIGQSDNKENVSDYAKIRDPLSPDSVNSSGILKEISNSTRRRTNSRTILGDIFGFADDEKDENTQPDSSDMLFKVGSIRSIKNTKRIKRVSSLQHVKYIEYLEAELASAEEKLEALRSPETVKGQAAKIRKLEKQVQELTIQIKEWEDGYEERVNDAVFERVHGESNLRIKIAGLESAAAYKEAHIAEIGKELEDAKIKLIESESVEVTLSKRVDVLTELLAKSPTRTSFATSITDVVANGRSSIAGPILSASPTRVNPDDNTLDRCIQRSSLLLSSLSEIEMDQSFVAKEQVLETDNESNSLESTSRPVSEIFSTRASHTSSSRPTSMFSMSSVGAWSAAEEKTAGRPKRSRRFAPGATGLKPLLLPTTAGLPSYVETPKKDYTDSDIRDWESAGEMPTSTPSRPRPRRPYSWAHSPAVVRNDSIHEDDESGEDTFVVEKDKVNDLPAYLQRLSEIPSPEARRFDESIGSSPMRSGLSLHQEFSLDESFSGLCEDSSLANENPCPPHTVPESAQASPTTLSSALQQHTTQPIDDDSLSSHLSDTIDQESDDMLPTSSVSTASTQTTDDCDKWIQYPRTSSTTNVAVALHQKSLNIARHVLSKSWTRGSRQIGGMAWWIIGLVLAPRRLHDTVFSTRDVAEDDKTSSTSNTSISQHPPSSANPTGLIPRGLLKILPHLHTIAFPESNHSKQYRCKHCIESRGKQNMKLWTKLAIALIIAIGYAVLEGPASVLAEDLPMADEHEPTTITETTEQMET